MDEGEECNWREITKVEKHRCNYIKRQNIFFVCKIVRGNLINTVPRNKPFKGLKLVYRKVFKGRNNWNSVAANRSVAVERNKDKWIKEGAHYI